MGFDGGGEETDEGSEPSSSVALEDLSWKGRMEYSPVSHIRRLPVCDEAVSMR